MKTPLGTEVDLGPGHTVLDGVPAPAKVAQQPPPPLFGPCLLWPRSPISATAELLLCFLTTACRPSQVLSTNFGRRGFITLDVHLCLPHISRDAEHRAVCLRLLPFIIIIIIDCRLLAYTYYHASEETWTYKIKIGLRMPRANSTLAAVQQCLAVR